MRKTEEEGKMDPTGDEHAGFNIDASSSTYTRTPPHCPFQYFIVEGKEGNAVHTVHARYIRKCN